MSAFTIAAIALALLCLSAVVAIVVGALASLVELPPGEAMTAAGHRAVAWVSLLCGVGVATLLLLERMAA